MSKSREWGGKTVARRRIQDLQCARGSTFAPIDANGTGSGNARVGKKDSWSSRDRKRNSA
eukprot:2439313-Pleurochrysis_carterae.AAC.2